MRERPPRVRGIFGSPPWKFSLRNVENRIVTQIGDIEASTSDCTTRTPKSMMGMSLVVVSVCDGSPYIALRTVSSDLRMRYLNALVTQHQPLELNGRGANAARFVTGEIMSTRADVWRAA